MSMTLLSPLPLRPQLHPTDPRGRRTRILHTAQYYYASLFSAPYKMGFAFRVSVSHTPHYKSSPSLKLKFSSTCRENTGIFQASIADTVAAVADQTSAIDITFVEIGEEEVAARPHLTAFLPRPT